MNLFEPTQSTSKYEGVSWNEKRQLWKAEFYFNEKTTKSYFQNELDAAKRITQLCEKMKIPSKNPELMKILNQRVTSSFLNQSLFIKSLTFWRTQTKKEIDFILDQHLALEIKSTIKID